MPATAHAPSRRHHSAMQLWEVHVQVCLVCPAVCFYPHVACVMPVLRSLCHAGVEAAGSAAFVLVAGGLGERLGYSGIKLALPADSARGACYLQVGRRPGCISPGTANSRWYRVPSCRTLGLLKQASRGHPVWHLVTVSGCNTATQYGWLTAGHSRTVQRALRPGKLLRTDAALTAGCLDGGQGLAQDGRCPRHLGADPAGLCREHPGPAAQGARGREQQPPAPGHHDQ